MVNLCRVFFGSFLILFINLFVYGVGSKHLSPAMILMLTHALAALVGWIFYWFCCSKPQEQRDKNIKEIFVVHLALMFLLYFIWSVLFPSEEYVKNFFTGSNADNAMKLLTILLLAPMAEEIAHRGIVFDSLSNLNNSRIMPIFAAFISSSIFMVSHGQYEHMSTYVLLFLVALLLCSARFFSKTLWVPIVIHSFASLCAVSL